MNIYLKKSELCEIQNLQLEFLPQKSELYCAHYKSYETKKPLKYHQWINKYLLSVTGKRRLGQIDEFISRLRL